VRGAGGRADASDATASDASCRDGSFDVCAASTVGIISARRCHTNCYSFVAPSANVAAANAAAARAAASDASCRDGSFDDCAASTIYSSAAVNSSRRCLPKYHASVAAAADAATDGIADSVVAPSNIPVAVFASITNCSSSFSVVAVQVLPGGTCADCC